MQCNATPYHAMICYDFQCIPMPCNATPCNVIACKTKPFNAMPLDRNYHIPSDHSNQPLSKYVTLQPELPLDRNYHIPSDHSNPSYMHHSNPLRSRSIVTNYARSIVTHFHSNTSTPPLSFWGAITILDQNLVCRWKSFTNRTEFLQHIRYMWLYVGEPMWACLSCLAHQRWRDVTRWQKEGRGCFQDPPFKIIQYSMPIILRYISRLSPAIKVFPRCSRVEGSFRPVFN